MRILITGFEAFAGSPVNPSEQVVLALKADPPPEVKLFTSILPVDALTAPAVLVETLRATSPQAVICLGEAAGRPVISIERAALNILDFRIPDNQGNQFADQPALAGGPNAYFSSLPFRAILETLRENGIPAELSLSAGAYLCNQVFFHLMHWAAQLAQPIQAGFIHLPSLHEQVALRGSPAPSMALETSIKAIRLTIHLLNSQILAESGNRLHGQRGSNDET
jgi:pyroglutamyl-peptidase